MRLGELLIVGETRLEVDGMEMPWDSEVSI